MLRIHRDMFYVVLNSAAETPQVTSTPCLGDTPAPRTSALFQPEKTQCSDRKICHYLQPISNGFIYMLSPLAY